MTTSDLFFLIFLMMTTSSSRSKLSELFFTCREIQTKFMRTSSIPPLSMSVDWTMWNVVDDRLTRERGKRFKSSSRPFAARTCTQFWEDSRLCKFIWVSHFTVNLGDFHEQSDIFEDRKNLLTEMKKRLSSLARAKRRGEVKPAKADEIGVKHLRAVVNFTLLHFTFFFFSKKVKWVFLWKNKS